MTDDQLCCGKAEPQTLRKYFKYVNINKHREASISFNIYK